jgi:glycosyltransferase involved in cell wall biosynthesis
MKIVEIILDLRRRAGAEVFFASLCDEFIKNPEIELTVISLWDDIHDSFKYLQNDPRVSFYSLSKKRGVDFKAARKLKKLLLDINPDIIHTHRSILMTYFFAFGLSKQNWKLVHTIHNTPGKEANRITWMLRKCYDKKKLITYVGISDLITREFSNLSKGSIVTIYNGIAIKTVNSDLAKQFDFINVARFSPAKNHRLLIDSFNDFYLEHNNATLICVGEGELRTEIEAYASTLNCYTNIIFYGPSNDVLALLSQSRVFILTSFYEGTPVSILEAMSVGLPIISPNVGGIPDILEDNVNGFLFEVCNKKQIVQLMEKIYDNRQLIERISKNNKEKVLKFSIEVCASNYLSLFEKLVNK